MYILVKCRKELGKLTTQLTRFVCNIYIYIHFKKYLFCHPFITFVYLLKVPSKGTIEVTSMIHN